MRIEIKEAYGDKAYFRKSILDILKEDEVVAYIPVSEAVYRLDEANIPTTKTRTNGSAKKATIPLRKQGIKEREIHSSIHL